VCSKCGVSRKPWRSAKKVHDTFKSDIIIIIIIIITIIIIFIIIIILVITFMQGIYIYLPETN